jgi:hypothetical protein
MDKFIFSLIFVLTFAFQSSAQSLLKDGKIPNDLVIILSLKGTIQFANYYDYKITSDRQVFSQEQINFPVTSSVSLLLNKKPQKLKDKLSKKQLKRIINEFESSGFFELNDYYENDPTFKDASCSNHALIKSLLISANGKTKKVGFFLGCGVGENSPLKKFLSLYEKIEAELKKVKKQKVENDKKFFTY